jgi:hypothetical protein
MGFDAAGRKLENQIPSVECVIFHRHTLPSARSSLLGRCLIRAMVVLRCAMAIKLEKRPIWAIRALQGVTFWIGHRRCLYKQYPLAEGALVAELCNLIHANLRDSYVLSCEVQYTELLAGNPRPGILTQRARADLVISEKPEDKNGEPTPRFIIEVKRASAPASQIDADLQRLAAVRKTHPGIRTFLFLIAEAHRPKRFVDEDGKSKTGKHSIPGSTGYYRIRRTLKAAHAYTEVGSAQYACFLEIYA